MRAWFNGRTLAFQACDEGSIPFARCIDPNAGVAQSVEHLHGKEKVVGSIPTPSFYSKGYANSRFAGVAQSVEHLHGKEKVVGSIPTPSF